MNSKSEQLANLKKHFGRRVHEQARSIVNSWSILEEVHWSEGWFNEFIGLAKKLQKLSSRYDFADLTQSSSALISLLEQCSPAQAPKTDALERLNDQVSAIAQACSRANDNVPVEEMSAGRKPVYLCFSDPLQGNVLKEQLSFFGIPVSCYQDASELERSISYRIPAAIVVDTQFEGQGIAVVTAIQKELRQAIPVLFYAKEEPTIEDRLQVVRAHGVAFYTGQLDFGLLVESLMGIYAMRNEAHFKVLVVDDSKSQALYAEKTLNQAGIFTRAVIKPLEVLRAIEEFSPDAILMDMYMPGCTGPEIAQVIRQQTKYDAIPILYLSAESDVDKQLDAVGLGGDDFLTKPVPKEVLISTVRNRCRRHRGLRDQMVRDGLTGLFDHNHILETLKQEVGLANANAQPLCFVMIDIDRFKQVNDQYGHSMGDRVIRALALYMRQRFRITDTIGRYGGEEFALVLPNTSADNARNLLEEVRHGFEQLVHQDGQHQIRVTFSCGIAQLQDKEEAALLSQRADLAMYKAKDAGRNRVEVAD
ncbi:diguanylate cyclase [Reinekea forsetii]|nr:diguanylate cyclase [Reinekea forsetii]